jgi:hypothetical protein
LVRAGHAEQPFAQIESNCGLFAFFLFLSRFFRLSSSRGIVAAILAVLQILVELPIALGHLFLAKLIAIPLLLQHK